MPANTHADRRSTVGKTRVAVIGAGAFGRNHLRVLSKMDEAELVAVVDRDAGRAERAAAEFGCPALEHWSRVPPGADAAVVAVPSEDHAEVGCGLLEAGVDVLVEKPIATTIEDARRLVRTAAANERILQVGHLESFNPAVIALREAATLPLFFEIHRMSVFSPRSLDVDVVLDLMIHDIDIVVSLTGSMPEEIRAAGVSILSERVDIANARLAFPSGCVANLTASRVSTDRVRKLRLFQPNEYVSLDYGRQEVAVFRVGADRQISFSQLPVRKDEPLRLELEAFLASVVHRTPPEVGGEQALKALEVAVGIAAEIERHGETVRRSVSELS